MRRSKLDTVSYGVDDIYRHTARIGAHAGKLLEHSYSEIRQVFFN